VRPYSQVRGRRGGGRHWEPAGCVCRSALKHTHLAAAPLPPFNVTHS
jgi:hypothetical protein